MPIDFQKLQSLFEAAISSHEPDTWDQFVDQECRNDPELRSQLKQLLKAHQHGASALDSPPADIEVTRIGSVTEESGDVIGAYKLLQQIGEGGMGTVFMAEQTEPVERRVALKIIKAGMDSKQVIARFEAERQALAMMDHPNIAKVLDAGTTDSGRPYFVMELVKGVPLTAFCDEHQLTPRQRLELFVPVCQAVQHAHQKGIIHRDIKPSNILVAQYDDRAIPKVIDFGVAKAVSHKLTEKTMFTQYGQIVGTVEYMSPEQARFNQLDVDTRSDVYSLGVLLYELLTGETPFDKKRLRSAAFDELLRILREEEPPRPSFRLSTSQALPAIAANRHIEPQKLSNMVRGELDWIVMKCLEKQRDRRYETANGLARDIERYLSNEIVEARPPSVSYRFQKFVRRNKGPVVTTSLVVISLIAGIIGTSLGWKEASHQKQLADQRAEGERDARLDAQNNEAEAVTQRKRAEAGEKLAEERLALVESEKQKVEQEKRIAESVKNFLQRMLEQADAKSQANVLLSQTGSLSQLKHNPTIRELLDRSAALLENEKIDSSIPDQPLLQAEILRTVGTSYYGLGEFEKAVSCLDRAWKGFTRELGPSDPRTITCLGLLGSAHGDCGRFSQAIRLLEQAYDAAVINCGPEHETTTTIMNNLAMAYSGNHQADLALPLIEKTYQINKSVAGTEQVKTLTSMSNYAKALHEAGQKQKALEIFEEGYHIARDELSPKHPLTLKFMNNLAAVYEMAGRRDEASQLFEQSLQIQKTIRSLDHPDMLNATLNLANQYLRSVRADEAVPMLAWVYAMQEEKYGPNHDQTIESMIDLASAYEKTAQPEKGLKLLEEAFRRTEQHFESDHPIWFKAGFNLALTYDRRNQHNEAEQTYRRVLAERERLKGSDDPETLSIIQNLANIYLDTGRYDDAERLYRQVLKARQKTQDPDHPYIMTCMTGLAKCLREQEKFLEGSIFLREALELELQKLNRTDPAVEWTRGELEYLAWVIVKQSDRTPNEYAEALKAADSLFELRRDEVSYWNWRALAFYRNGRIEEALENFEKAQSMLADYNIAMSGIIAIAHWKAGHREEALKHFVKLQAHCGSRLLIGDFIELDFLVEALEFIPAEEIEAYCTEHINEDPESSRTDEYYLTRAKLFERQERFDAAVADYLKVIDRESENDNWGSDQTALRLNLAQNEELYNRLIQARPDDRSLRLARGRYYGLCGRWAEAADEYLPWPPVGELEAEQIAEIGCVLLLSDNTEGYTRYIESLDREFVYDVQPWPAFSLARAAVLVPQSKEMTEKSLHWAKTAADKDRNAWQKFVHGMALYRAKRYQEAIEVMKESEELGWPDEARAQNWLALAMTYHALGDLEEARKWFVKADDLITQRRASAGNGPIGMGSIDWFCYSVLRPEADELFQIRDEPLIAPRPSGDDASNERISD